MTEDVDTRKPDQALLPDLASPARLQRLANVAINQLGLTILDVDVEPREDGRVALVLPEAWMYLMLSQLAMQAQIIQEKLRKATWQARMKDARLQAEVQRAAEEWQREQEKVYGRYKALVAKGLTHREAIRQIKRESPGLTATTVADIVQYGEGRQKKQARRDRDQRIQELAKTLTRKQIAEQGGLTVSQVKEALRRERRRDHGKAKG